MPLYFPPFPQNLRLGLAYASGTVSAHNRTHERAENWQCNYRAANELLSNLPLQMLLYFNSFYFPCWWLSEMFMLEVKFSVLPGYYQGILVTGVVLITAFEALRLYLGYVGNLNEKIPELAGFWLLSFLFQLPILLFLLTDEGAIILPLERAVHSVYLAFLLSELAAAALALRTMSRKLSLQFHLRQFGEVRCSPPADRSPAFSLPYRRSVFPVSAAEDIHL
ncbi:transmembrane protein 17A [Brienomyrus brachyistius]|uniref:transmembrane protein 17A n=1 Tax=Brienomyrus brachyistius TaxID=42636 RepID=UPI0020B30836|nr:transmembrane protein 17A [Brienomyrus brachyistius]